MKEGEGRGQSHGVVPDLATRHHRGAATKHGGVERIKAHPALHPQIGPAPLQRNAVPPHPRAPPSRGGAGLVLCVLLEPRRRLRQRRQLNLEPSSRPSSAINLTAGVTDLVPIFQLLFQETERGHTRSLSLAGSG